MIEIIGISKNYGDIRALDSISFTIKEGEILGLVGPNGSGKSTLLRILAGILRPSSGKILIEGRELSERDWVSFKRRIGYMPERISFYDNLSGWEVLRLFARIKGVRFESIPDLLKGIVSEDFLRRRVGGYSKGMRQRLNLAQALVNDPDILILDEPTSGLDPVGTKDFYEALQAVREKKRLTVLLSSHILAEIEERVDRVAILKNGILKAIGSLPDLYTNLNLPFKLSILPALSRNGTVEEVLKREGIKEIVKKDGYIFATVERSEKMRVLSALMEKRDSFVDLNVIEPSLEEVFFGIH